MALAANPYDWSQYYDLPPTTAAQTGPTSQVNTANIPTLPNAAPVDTGVVGPPKPTGPPSGGSLRDPAYVRQLVDYYATQPGANPSLKNDPDYWVRTITTSPEWATADQAFAVSKFMQPEGAAAGGGLGGLAIDPSYLAPFTQAPPSYTKPGAFSFPDFAAPTPESMYADPSFKFRVQTGEQALENSAAARGVLNTGGTLGDIAKFSQDFASQEYPNIYNRALNSYQTNRGNQLGNYLTNVQTQSTDPFNFNTEAWRNARDTFFSNEQNPWGKLLGAATLGFNSANA